MDVGHAKELEYLIRSTMMSPGVADCLRDLIKDIERAAVRQWIAQVDKGLEQAMLVIARKQQR